MSYSTTFTSAARHFDLVLLCHTTQLDALVTPHTTSTFTMSIMEENVVASRIGTELLKGLLGSIAWSMIGVLQRTNHGQLNRRSLCYLESMGNGLSRSLLGVQAGKAAGRYHGQNSTRKILKLFETR
jgi:hypothetical protein